MKSPYEYLKKNELWETIDNSIFDLINNNDIKECTNRDYISGYICENIIKFLNLKNEKK